MEAGYHLQGKTVRKDRVLITTCTTICAETNRSPAATSPALTILPKNFSRVV